MTTLADRWDAVPLRTKITGVTVLLLTAGLVVAGLGTMAVLRSYLLEQVDRQLASNLSQIGQDGTVDLSSPSDYVESESSPFNPYYLAVVTVDGELIADNRSTASNAGPDWTRIDVAVLEDGTRYLTARSDDRLVQWRLLLTKIVGGQAILVIGSDLEEADATVARFGLVFAFFALTVIVLGGVITRFLATSTFAPLRRLEDQAARFADGDYSQRLTSAPPNTEVGRLTRSLNTMLARIDNALADRGRTIEQMRRFVGDASHELRTPLVTVRGYAELYRMGALTDAEAVGQAMERIEKEATRMSGLVTDLLELARLDASATGGATSTGSFGAVDLVPLAGDAARDAMAQSPGRLVTLVGLEQESLAGPVRAVQPADTPSTPMPIPASEDTRTRPIPLFSRWRRSRTQPIQVIKAETPPPPPDLDAIVRGDEDKIRQVLANLVSNAMRYSPEGSPVEIGVGVEPATRRGVVAVIDHGEGVPEAIRDKIFQRFWRADTSRARETGGNGLGLAIVAAIVQAHGGTVDVIDTTGGGATFRVWLPLA